MRRSTHAQLRFFLFQLSRRENFLELIRYCLHHFVLCFELFFLFLENVSFLNDFLFGFAHYLLFPAFVVTVAPLFLTDDKDSLPQAVQILVNFLNFFEDFGGDLELTFVAALAFEVKFFFENDGHFDFGESIFLFHDLIHFLFDFFLLIFKRCKFFPERKEFLFKGGTVSLFSEWLKKYMMIVVASSSFSLCFLSSAF